MSPFKAGAGSPPSRGPASVFILSGPVHSGKTTFLEERAALAREQGVPVQGYLSPSIWSEKRHIGYDLLSLAEGQAFPFIREKGWLEGQNVGPYFLIPETLALAQRIIRQASGARLLVVDEIGPLELEGKGVWPALADALDKSPRRILVTIRDGLVDPFRRKVPSFDFAVVFGVGDNEAAAEAFGLPS